MDYLRWAKLHEKATYELTLSDVPRVRHEEFGVDQAEIGLEVEGPYGHPTFIKLLSERYSMATERILPVPGASCGNFIALGAVARPGDTVVLEQPIYGPIRKAADFLDLRVVPLHRRPETGFDVEIGEIEAGLQAGARAVVLTNLHNPSGRLLPRDTIEQIAGLCGRHDAVLIVDEVYLDSAYLNLDAPIWAAATVADNVISVNSLTKVYGLSGLRAGWLFLPAGLVERAQAVLDILSVDNAAPAASLAIHALRRIERWEERFRGYYREGRPIFEAWLAAEPLVTACHNYGAVFECLRLPDGVNASRFNDRLVAEHDTQVVPGTFFGLDDHIRLSTTLPAPGLKEALSCISACLRECT